MTRERRESIGPRSSEPEQRTYVVERVDTQGHVLDHVHVRHFHALEAARAFAADSAIFGPFHEYAPAPGVWCISNADYVIRAASDPAALLRTPLTFMETDRGRDHTTNVRRSCSDERAALQRRIADAIRRVPVDEVEHAREVMLACLDEHPEGRLGGMPWVLVALAACAKYPEILDAVRQVAQVHALTEGEG